VRLVHRRSQRVAEVPAAPGGPAGPDRVEAEFLRPISAGWDLHERLGLSRMTGWQVVDTKVTDLRVGGSAARARSPAGQGCGPLTPTHPPSTCVLAGSRPTPASWLRAPRPPRRRSPPQYGWRSSSRWSLLNGYAGHDVPTAIRRVHPPALCWASSRW